MACPPPAAAESVNGDELATGVDLEAVNSAGLRAAGAAFGMGVLAVGAVTVGLLAGNRIFVLHFGHSIWAGWLSSLTDNFMLHLGHATIFAPDADALGLADGTGFAGVVFAGAVAALAAVEAGFRAAAAAFPDAGTIEIAWHFGQRTCLPAEAGSTARVWAHVPHRMLILFDTTTPLEITQ